MGIILENGNGGCQSTSSTRVRLPRSITSSEPSQTWTVGSNARLPNKTGPASEAQEGRVIKTMISELQIKLALDMGPSLILNRSPGPRRENGPPFFLVVGSSNARRMHEAL